MPIRLEGMTLYTVKDIEVLLGVGNSTVRRYISEGRLKGRKMARRWYVPAESLLEYFQESDQGPPTALLEKLKQLEERLDQRDLNPPPIPVSPSKKQEPVRATPPAQVEELSEVEQLIRQAKRLKAEAARIERLYGSSSGDPADEDNQS